jgi:hypothetical protein
VTITSAGVVGALSYGTPYQPGIMPLSRPITIGSSNYAVVLYRGPLMSPAGGQITAQLQPTYFLVQLDSAALGPLVVARFGAGVANSQSNLETIVGYMPSVTLQSGSKYLFACGIEIQEFLSDFFATPEFFPGGLIWRVFLLDRFRWLKLLHGN